MKCIYKVTWYKVINTKINFISVNQQKIKTLCLGIRNLEVQKKKKRMKERNAKLILKHESKELTFPTTKFKRKLQ